MGTNPVAKVLKKARNIQGSGNRENPGPRQDDYTGDILLSVPPQSHCYFPSPVSARLKHSKGFCSLIPCLSAGIQHQEQTNKVKQRRKTTVLLVLRKRGIIPIATTSSQATKRS